MGMARVKAMSGLGTRSSPGIDRVASSVVTPQRKCLGRITNPYNAYAAARPNATVVIVEHLDMLNLASRSLFLIRHSADFAGPTATIDQLARRGRESHRP